MNQTIALSPSVEQAAQPPSVEATTQPIQTRLHCANCLASDVPAPGKRLPQGWEPYRVLDYDGPLWCPRCISELIRSTLDLMRDSVATMTVLDSEDLAGD